MHPRRAPIAYTIATLIAVFHMYAAGVAPFTALVQRPVHLAAMAALGFLGLGVRGLTDGPSHRTTRLRFVLDWTLIAAAALTCGYLIGNHEALVQRVGQSTALDQVAGVLAVIIVLELARRSTGWGLVSIAVLALGYAMTGPFLPGILAHRGYGPTRIIEHLYLSTEGIWGVPLGVSADFVYLFILFGALLDIAGGGQLLIALADKIAGRSRGGPAKTAAVSSALMGSLSGSAVANVVTTGSLTIPLMKRMGFSPAFAGAIESAASTGGQLMPPVMGAGAFILATWTNIPYVRVAAAALIPAVLYYVALLGAIHFQAGRAGLTASAPNDEHISKRLHLLIPLAVIVTLLAMGRSPMRAAFWGVVGAALASVALQATRLDRQKMRQVIERAAGGTVQVAAACAAAGIVVGVASLTGVGLRMSELVITLSGGHLPVALGLTAIGSIVLGMGLPTTAAYVVLAALGAPALTELGVPILAAHLFIFYFGAMSNVTPPVSLAAYAAAGIAGSPPMQTGFTAMALAGGGFVVPFLFVYKPGLLLDAPLIEIAVATTASSVAVVAVAAAAVGFWQRRLTLLHRISLLVAAGALLLPWVAAQLAGVVLLLGTVFHHARSGSPVPA